MADYRSARGIQRLLPPAYTPASHGVVERRNGISKSLSFRLYESSRGDIAKGGFGVGDVLVAACATKNAAARKGGFSAQYLVFGYRPQFHSAVEGPLSAGAGALGEFVRQRDLLRSRAQALFLEIRAPETLRKAPGSA